jgi:non-specific serine/threonine protein kinase/serine/threonine-protein kinase
MTEDEHSGSDGGLPSSDTASGDHPSQIGPYRILDVLGEGGMSVVYLAEQSEPVKRRVALKILKAGMDSKQIVARFESERQALAVLDHPNVAKIFDGGIAESGRPYFVMEQVKGVPITDYCDAQRLNNEERLKIFINVCAAVQHAHLKGLIHRDLKPSNILVGVVDGQPQPKIIDFGIAKATTTTLTEATLYTRVGQIIGTPQYMSPEQADLTGVDIDTRTDIYSLGVVLYELLVGTVPLELRGLGDQAMQVALREKDPPKPSTRFTDLGDTRGEIAKTRRTVPDRLRHQLQGDLDWIVMRAIEKDRTRRYETVNALAMECRRFLNHEPVLARPPSPGYLLNRFVKRNRLAVVAGSIAILAVIAGAAVATFGYLRATEAEQVARQEAKTAQRVTDFLVNLFEASDPFAETQGDFTVRELLDRGSNRIEYGLANEPQLQARLLATIGEVHTQLGLFDAARIFLDDALATQQSILDSNDPQILRTQIRRAWLATQTGNYDHAQSIYDAILPPLDEGLRFSDVLKPTSDWVEAINDLGVLQWHTNDLKSAKSTLTQALAMGEEIYGVEGVEVATTLNNLALVFAYSVEHETARPLYERALSILEKDQGPNHPGLSSLIMNLASTVRSLGDFDAAQALLERALRIAKASFAPDHPIFAVLNNGLGIVLWNQDNYDEALERLEHAGKLFVESYGAAGPGVGENLQHQARVYHSTGELDRSKLLYERSAEALGGHGPGTASELAEVLEKLGDIDGALKHHQIANELFSQMFDATNPYVIKKMKLYEEFLQRNGLEP